MAKMFYTLEEAAKRLNMSVEQVQQLTETGQLQEFRDRDQVMLKVDQVDLLAGDDEDEPIIPLAESGELEAIGLASSDTGSAFTSPPQETDSKEQTGVSIFDADSDDADPAAQTQVSSAPAFTDFGDASSSGSGLANLTLEADDTSLGAELLDDVYGGGSGAAAAGGSSMTTGAPSESALGMPAGLGGQDQPLFGGAEEPADISGAAPVMSLEEEFDGPWSGIVGGVALGTAFVLLAALMVVILAVTGSTAVVGSLSAGVIYGIVGGAAALMLIGAAVGWVLLKNSAA